MGRTARGGGAFVGGVSAAAFPVAIALSASWNVDLVSEVGSAPAKEAKSKGARYLQKRGGGDAPPRSRGDPRALD